MPDIANDFIRTAEIQISLAKQLQGKPQTRRDYLDRAAQCLRRAANAPHDAAQSKRIRELAGKIDRLYSREAV